MKKALAICTLAAASAFAASQPQTHDGFYLSLAMGMGFQSIDFVLDDHDDRTTSQSGLATDIDVKIGFSLTNNLALHMTLAGNTPTSTIYDLEDFNEDDEFEDFKANLSILGIGATYYFPGNYFASASIGIGQFRVCDDIATFQANVQSSPDDYSRSGFAFQLAGGKEWWVSENWGIGATAAILYGRETNLGDATESSFGVSVRFTATYN